MQKRLEIFCCYAREDHTLLLELRKHLTALQRVLPITIWHDAHISPGRDWENEIKKHLNRAQVILLLVSPDFMASDYCYSNELQHAMQRHARGEARVIPIILRPVHWQGTPFAKLQALPMNAQPITSPSWHNQDEAFLDVVGGIRQAVEELSTASHDAPGVNRDENFSERTERDNFLSRPSRKEPENFSRRSSELPPRRQKAARQTQMPHTQDNSLANQNKPVSPETSTPTAQQTNTDPSSLSQAYEVLRRQIETKIDRGYSRGAVVVITSHDQINKVVHLQIANLYRDGRDYDPRMEYARAQLWTIQGHSIVAAIFKDVWQGEYAAWIDQKKAVIAVVCPEEATLIELNQRNWNFFSRPGNARVIGIFSVVVCTLSGGILGYMLKLPLNLGLFVGFLFGLAIVLLLK